MIGLENLSVKISNYKCFGEDGYGFDKILPINLIIGRNNSGKSTLLELIDYLTRPKSLDHLGNGGKSPIISVTGTLSKEDLYTVFPDNASYGPLPGNHWDFGRNWIGKRITWEGKANDFGFICVDPPFGIADGGFRSYEHQLAQKKGNPFSFLTFKRLLTDRDISAEKRGDSHVRSDGEGATRIICNFINRASLPSDLVEQTLLNELNSIFEPDGEFTDIVVQQIDQNGEEYWEIFLEETEKGRVPLSHTGSGLKTILLVLIFLHLIPHTEKKPLSEYFFGFEELENNLHPALQRRLLLYFRKTAIEKGCVFFLTTHSNIAIDLFANDDKAQILHVTHNRKCASVKRVNTYVDNKGILDDLDVRASDLLQANGIVWLEGPSDRLYFNRWIELWTGGKIREGTHYQCVFYGGRLLAHLSASYPDVNQEEVIKILRVNRNAVLLIDSDRKQQGASLTATKKRIISEIEDRKGLAWVTVGKEIENYIPTAAIESLYNIETLSPLKLFQDFTSLLDKIESGAGKTDLRNKVLFAEKICPYITKEQLESTFDLAKQLSTACDMILSWNGNDKMLITDRV